MRQLTAKRPKRSAFKILAILAFAFLVSILIIKSFNLTELIIKGPKTVIQLVTDSGPKSTNGRTNILLLGIGGEGHEGPNLSDTIILASLDKEGKDVALVTIPRDVWAPNISSKINHAYAYGQEKNGLGLDLAKETVSKLFDIPVHYAIRIDFSGFTKAVDQLGGLDITIDNSFTDPKYPIEGKEDDTCGLEIEAKIEEGIKNTYYKDATGSATLVTEENDPFTCRYETLTFKKGPILLDGKTALKFVRSRHGTNGEGSDFARSARQEKVITAFRQQIISTETFFNPKTIIDLITTFGNSIDTDIRNDDVAPFVKLGQKLTNAQIRRIVLDSGRPESTLTDGDPTNYGGQYVLIPKNGSWSDLAEYVQGEIFKLKEEEQVQKGN